MTLGTRQSITKTIIIKQSDQPNCHLEQGREIYPQSQTSPIVVIKTI